MYLHAVQLNLFRISDLINIPTEVMLSSSTPNRTFDIGIQDDKDLEGVESFILGLSFTAGEISPPEFDTT